MTGVWRLLTAAILLGAAALPAQAQKPSKAETDAVRNNCRSDYMAKCMSVKPGGIEAIQCLKKNDASLSPACQSAVAAIKLPGEAAPAAAAPAPSAPPPAAAAPAPAPAPAAAKPAPAPKPVVAAPEKPQPPKPTQAKPAAAPKPAVAAARPAPVAAPPPAVSTAPHPPTLQEAQLVRLYCTVDYQVLCQRVPIGDGRVIKCLSDNQPALSPNCKQAIAKAQ